ncbi:hypothetical protein KZ483_09745 [Paenibacillus sp. sptzw28]|uniref:hypothetical protein n=1 Tax=Paenibacillus sp. sptzw28 TaxID=715179 RepID=UPI001C6F11B2|nr:hypothetical protein [Paenibacillus sp. sptzw28]QYR23170.1 hypothetical protein KZ483_09745 [Paenibacillus sp. sptzw28]
MLVTAKVLSVAFILFLIGLYEWPKINRRLKRERIVFVLLCTLTLVVSEEPIGYPKMPGDISIAECDSNILQAGAIHYGGNVAFLVLHLKE